MTCGAATPIFRLLDPRVGWDAADAMGLTGLDDAGGITLAPLDADAVDGDWLASLMPPPWLAAWCDHCTWFMLPPAKRLFRIDGCACAWSEHWPAGCTPLQGTAIGAIAAVRHLIALADRAFGRVIVAAADGRAVVADIACGTEPFLIAFDCCGALLVAVQGETHLRRFDLSGAALPAFSASLPSGVLRLAATGDGAVWV